MSLNEQMRAIQARAKEPRTVRDRLRAIMRNHGHDPDLLTFLRLAAKSIDQSARVLAVPLVDGVATCPLDGCRSSWVAERVTDGRTGQELASGGYWTRPKGCEHMLSVVNGTAYLCENVRPVACILAQDGRTVVTAASESLAMEIACEMGYAVRETEAAVGKGQSFVSLSHGYAYDEVLVPARDCPDCRCGLEIPGIGCGVCDGPDWAEIEALHDRLKEADA